MPHNEDYSGKRIWRWSSSDSRDRFSLGNVVYFYPHLDNIQTTTFPSGHALPFPFSLSLSFRLLSQPFETCDGMAVPLEWRKEIFFLDLTLHAPCLLRAQIFCPIFSLFAIIWFSDLAKSSPEEKTADFEESLVDFQGLGASQRKRNFVESSEKIEKDPLSVLLSGSGTKRLWGCVSPL